jgi:hypothetical protein
MKHDWQLAPVSVGNTIWAVAICRQCGTTRSVISGRTDKRIDLAGECRTDEPITETPLPTIVAG